MPGEHLNNWTVHYLSSSWTVPFPIMQVEIYLRYMYTYCIPGPWDTHENKQFKRPFDGQLCVSAGFAQIVGFGALDLYQPPVAGSVAPVTHKEIDRGLYLHFRTTTGPRIAGIWEYGSSSMLVVQNYTKNSWGVPQRPYTKRDWWVVRIRFDQTQLFLLPMGTHVSFMFRGYGYNPYIGRCKPSCFPWVVGVQGKGVSYESNFYHWKTHHQPGSEIAPSTSFAISADNSLGGLCITKHFRYLKWRNPHLYKLYVRLM